MIKITIPSVAKPDPLVISNYIFSRIQALTRDSIREFIDVTRNELGKYASSGAQGPSHLTPYIDSGMTMSVLLPLASHRERGGSIGRGRTVQSFVVSKTQEAVSIFPYKSAPKSGPQRSTKRGKDRTRKREKGKDAGDNYVLDYGSPSSVQVRFEFNLDKVAEKVPQIKKHSRLEKAFETGADALIQYFIKELPNYIKNKDLRRYLLEGKVPKDIL